MTTFTDTEKTDIRRFCGYPPKRTDSNTILWGVITNAQGNLEVVMNRLTAEEEAVVRTKLADLRILEAAIPAAAGNLDTLAVASLTQNPAELSQRIALFDEWRVRFCNFLNIPAGPFLRRGGGKTMVV